jgi:hypothetical protein
MIEVVCPAEVLAYARTNLGLPQDGQTVLDEGYIASALRRLAGFLCPCSPRTLVRSMVESHRGLVDDAGTFEQRLEDSVETLVAIGDLLELNDVALEGDAVKGTWLVAAPPTFVARESGSVFILGLAADEQTPLPSEMRTRVSCRRAIRSISPQPGDDVAAALRELGVRELSSTAWLRTPRKLPAGDLIGLFDARLSILGASGEVPDLLVLNGARATRSYRQRWGPAGSLSGRYVVRRPQTFGSDLWGYAELRDGQSVRLLDLPLPGDRWRGCDVAWRLQLAIDALAGRPQEYRIVCNGAGVRLDLFSPIPLWARRRLAIVGEETEAAGCLMSFQLPDDEAPAEEKFLREQLYLARSAD